MGALKMESTELRNLGTEIQGNAANFNSLITSFTSQYQALTAGGTWEGPDSLNFAQAASNFAGDLTKAATMVDEVGGNLVTTANNYDAVHESVSSGISGMLG